MDQISPELTWHKSSKSAQQDNCIEAADLPGGGRAIRDSKDPNGPVLCFASSEWRSFIRGIKSGGFDNLGC
ncbi:DUF397 domain-containing protein [Streptosporangium sp. NBC_01755]|uniref:DUF397 domain-containing protein n=1 Tax=unclassified Streptosporangium TaxID=2632669 RepID=UPI002DD933E4|nr:MULTISPECIES: DUF397 domain-containing protein [unclassified Streptosporangium]WSA26422.1 DUF397 domain-containing protein [Streptosporangium sp. NBC_01810]WSD02148.1 DUF397 domain-containing protein [Streptosporangium sp. NBC_01755]